MFIEQMILSSYCKVNYGKNDYVSKLIKMIQPYVKLVLTTKMVDKFIEEDLIDNIIKEKRISKHWKKL